jgi:hypothetical protein
MENAICVQGERLMTNDRAIQIITETLAEGWARTPEQIDAFDHARLVLSETADREQRDLVEALDYLDIKLEERRGART